MREKNVVQTSRDSDRNSRSVASITTFNASLRARTKDILHIKRLLGHKKLENTETYTHLIDFESDEWRVAYAKNLEEETKLIEAGFKYVRTARETMWLYIGNANEKVVLFGLR